MNIFALDPKPEVAASYHCDKHVVKMCTEYAQILFTAARLLGHDCPKGYKSTHIRHPSVQWAAKNERNWCWLYRLALSLGREYTARYLRVHASTIALGDLPVNLIITASYLGETLPPDLPLAMPEQYHMEDPVEAYRAYYSGEKSQFAKYKPPSKAPKWLVYKDSALL